MARQRQSRHQWLEYKQRYDECMFERYGYNPDTSGWTTSNVTSMYLMFKDAAAANPDTSTGYE